MTSSLYFDRVAKSFRAPDLADGLLEGVSFGMNEGECLSLLGSNGGGKSTILRMACGLLLPDQGVVRVYGEDPARSGLARAKLVVVFEGGRALYPRLTPIENFNYLTSLRALKASDYRSRFNANCERFGIASYLGRSLQQLSKGTQQKVAVCCALSVPTSLWVLDEPTLGMDIDSIIALGELLREHCKQGGSALLATHEHEFASAAGAVIDVACFHAHRGRSGDVALDAVTL